MGWSSDNRSLLASGNVFALISWWVRLAPPFFSRYSNTVWAVLGHWHWLALRCGTLRQTSLNFLWRLILFGRILVVYFWRYLWAFWVLKRARRVWVRDDFGWWLWPRFPWVCFRKVILDCRSLLLFLGRSVPFVFLLRIWIGGTGLRLGLDIYVL